MYIKTFLLKCVDMSSDIVYYCFNRVARDRLGIEDQAGLYVQLFYFYKGWGLCEFKETA